MLKPGIKEIVGDIVLLMSNFSSYMPTRFFPHPTNRLNVHAEVLKKVYSDFLKQDFAEYFEFANDEDLRSLGLSSVRSLSYFDPEEKKLIEGFKDLLRFYLRDGVLFVYLVAPITKGETLSDEEVQANIERIRQVYHPIRQKLGWLRVKNPVDFVYNGYNWETSLRLLLSELTTSHAVIALDGWEESPGCNLEIDVARRLGISIVFYNNNFEEVIENLKKIRNDIYSKFKKHYKQTKEEL